MENMFTEDFIHLVEKTAVAYSVINIKSLINESEISAVVVPELNYHLHMLAYFDEESKSGGVICLDTSDHQFFPDYGKDGKTDIMREIALQHAILFSEKLDAHLAHSDKYTLKDILRKADNRLWDTYDEIKIATLEQSIAQNRLSRVAIQTPQEKEVADLLLGNELTRPNIRHKSYQIKYEESRMLR